MLFSKVLFDFTVQFPNADANGLLQKWEQYAPTIGKVLEMEKAVVSTGWNDDVEKFMALVKLLPAKSGKSPVMPFIKVVERLMIHSEVSSQLAQLMNLYELSA